MRMSLYGIIAILLVGVSVWFILQRNPGTSPVPSAAAKHSISWKFTDAGEDSQAIPHTSVTAVVDGTEYNAGTYTGNCSEIGASGGIDGTGLVQGELSGVQCYFAGGGDEIGVFSENGALVIKKGVLDEGSAEIPAVRGNFQTVMSVRL
ncbi:hypothetical protein K8R03_02125 [Candidatus Kaiserbacteria bacterium]|nr:hypothetical protein [Candidatus Kaiserbacteria bacterium]